MAGTDADELEIKPADAGTAFRLEMFATQMVLGYWKHAVGLVVFVLLCVLVAGLYQSNVQNTQRATSATIAREVGKLPKPFLELNEDAAQGNPIDKPAVEAVGDSLVAIANGANGVAAIEARMDAAEAYRIAGNAAKQREALERVATDASGLFAYSAKSALANLDLEEGKGEDAVGRLVALSKEPGYLGEQATIDLALAYEHLDRKADALATYTDFVARFPTSKRLDEVNARLARVQ